MDPHTRLPTAFFAHDALDVARALIGRWLVHGEVTLRITEVEAYRWPGDTANHCRAGKTARNAPMWGPPGRAYVYRCYGVHQMLNLVTDRDEEGAAVLIRGAEIVAGHDVVTARRGRSGPGTLAGPGKVAAALALDGSFNHHDVCAPGGLECRWGTPAATLLAGPRVGIDYASEADRRAPWRIADAASTEVSHRRHLRPA